MLYLTRIFAHFTQYACVSCGSCLYCRPFLGIWANVRPHTPILASDATLPSQKIFSENFGLRIKNCSLKIFLLNFYL